MGRVEERDNHNAAAGGGFGEHPERRGFVFVVVAGINTGGGEASDVGGGSVRVLSVNVGEGLRRGNVEGVAGRRDGGAQGEEVRDGSVKVEGAGDGLSGASLES